MRSHRLFLALCASAALLVAAAAASHAADETAPAAAQSLDRYLVHIGGMT